MAKDPICGMTVDESSPLRAVSAGQTYYFCSEHCRKKFVEQAPRVESIAFEPGTADLDPAISAADKALENGTVEPRVKLLTDGLQVELGERFKQAVVKKKFAKDDLTAGQLCKKYAEFIHYLERIYDAAKNPSIILNLNELRIKISGPARQTNEGDAI